MSRERGGRHGRGLSGRLFVAALVGALAASCTGPSDQIDRLGQQPSGNGASETGNSLRPVPRPSEVERGVFYAQRLPEGFAFERTYTHTVVPGIREFGVVYARTDGRGVELITVATIRNPHSAEGEPFRHFATAEERSQSHVVSATTVRNGREAEIFDRGEGNQVKWEERGSVVSVRGRSVSLDTVLSVVEVLDAYDD